MRNVQMKPTSTTGAIFVTIVTAVVIKFRTPFGVKNRQSESRNILLGYAVSYLMHCSGYLLTYNVTNCLHYRRHITQLNVYSVNEPLFIFTLLLPKNINVLLV